MSRMSHLTDHALELAEQASAGLRHASQSLRDAGVDAERWIKTGAALGAAKAGVGYARNTVRRHPVAVATAAAVVGAGVLAYVLYRKGRKRRQQEARPQDAPEARARPPRRKLSRVHSTRAAAGGLHALWPHPTHDTID